MLSWVMQRPTDAGDGWKFDDLNFHDDEDSLPDNDTEELSSLTAGNYVTGAEAEQLAKVSDTRRIIVVNNQPKGISYAVLADILLALMIELGLLGGFYFLSHWVFTGQGGGGGNAVGSSNNAAIGGILIGDDAALPLTADLPQQKTPPLPQLPNRPLWQPSVSPTEILNTQNPDNSQQVIIGVKSNQDPWRAPTPQPSTKQTVTVAENSQVPARTSRNVMPSRDADPDAGFGDPYSFSKTAGPGGVGGSDDAGRGPSDANNPVPDELYSPGPPALPPLYDDVSVSTVLQFTVLSDGHVDPNSVSVIESSGHSDVDEAYENYVKQIIFRPAILNGKPVSQTYQLSLSNDLSN